jgi:putative monooxygenase
LSEQTPPITEAILSSATSSGAAAGTGGVILRTFVSKACGASGFSTGTATFQPHACLPYHVHPFSEAVTVLEGRAQVYAEGRIYLLNPKDCVHFPAGIAHQVMNHDSDSQLVAHWAFATAAPTRDLVDTSFEQIERGLANPTEADPETIIRYKAESIYELSDQAYFLDLFARRYGSIGICGGHGRFMPGASLPCHIHDFDESITIIKGTATCLVEGRQYQLSGCDTAFIPKGLPHRFINLSVDEMEMIWVYAGSEPDRIVVKSDYCAGSLVWPGASFTDKLL